MLADADAYLRRDTKTVYGYRFTFTVDVVVSVVLMSPGWIIQGDNR
jgi:hypothetical protein